MSISNDLKTVLVALKSPLKLECPVCGLAYTAAIRIDNGEYHVTIRKRTHTWCYSARKAAEIIEIVAQTIDDHTTCNLHGLDDLAHRIKMNDTTFIQETLKTRFGWVVVPNNTLFRIRIGKKATATVTIIDQDQRPLLSVLAPDFIRTVIA